MDRIVAVVFTQAFWPSRLCGIHAIECVRAWRRLGSRRMERPLAGPYEMRGVGRLDTRVAGLGEALPLLGPLAVAHVHRRGGPEVEIVGVEAQDSQQP